MAPAETDLGTSPFSSMSAASSPVKNVKHAIEQGTSTLQQVYTCNFQHVSNVKKVSSLLSGLCLPHPGSNAFHASQQKGARSSGAAGGCC